MKTCGIEITGSKAIFTMLEKREHEIIDLTGKFTQQSISDDEDCAGLRSFFNTVTAYFDSAAPDKIAVLKRNKNGKFRGSPESFKIEALIQLYSKTEVRLISPHTIRKYLKDNNITVTPKFKYQESSNVLALYLLDN